MYAILTQTNDTHFSPLVYYEELVVIGGFSYKLQLVCNIIKCKTLIFFKTSLFTTTSKHFWPSATRICIEIAIKKAIFSSHSRGFLIYQIEVQSNPLRRFAGRKSVAWCGAIPIPPAFTSADSRATIYSKIKSHTNEE